MNRLLDGMKETVRHEMREAVVTYEEKPREIWVLEPPAQVALCAVQIWWTVETNVAFLRLEEGFESSLKDFNKKQVRSFLVHVTTLTRWNDSWLPQEIPKMAEDCAS